MKSAKLFLWLFFALLLCYQHSLGLSQAQEGGPNQEWNWTFGGHHGDGAWSLQRTDDGGYIMAGYTSSRGEGSDLWLVKTDSGGMMQWNKTFGGSGEDVGYSAIQTKDGGYIAAGTTKSYGMGSEYLWLVRTDLNGSRLWDRTYGGFVTSSGDGAWSVLETEDGGYIIAGYTRSFGAGSKDAWMLKTDAEGRIQWERTFGGSKDDVGMSIARTREGGFLLAGRTASFGAGKDDIWLLKMDSNGKEIWNRTFGGPEDDVGFQVLEVEGGCIVVGRTESVSPGQKKAFLLKTDSKGRKLWQKVYGQGSTGISVLQTSEGGFILAGHIESIESSRDAWLVKTNPGGEEEWTMQLGGPRQDMASAVVESNDHCYVLAGITNSWGTGAEDLWMIKLRTKELI